MAQYFIKTSLQSFVWISASSSASCTSVPSATEHVIRPDAKEIERKHMELIYRCGKDEYDRPIVGQKQKGWASLVYDHSNLARKEETDWKMAYIARKENSKGPGFVTWKFDFSSVPSLSSISITLDSKTFENGRVNVQCCADEACFFLYGRFFVFICFNRVDPGDFRDFYLRRLRRSSLPRQILDLNLSSYWWKKLKHTWWKRRCKCLGRELKIEKEDLKGCKEFKLTATLMGGTGDVAWQHAQLFRTALDSNDDTFRIHVAFAE